MAQPAGSAAEEGEHGFGVEEMTRRTIAQWAKRLPLGFWRRKLLAEQRVFATRAVPTTAVASRDRVLGGGSWPNASITLPWIHHLPCASYEELARSDVDAVTSRYDNVFARLAAGAAAAGKHVLPRSRRGLAPTWKSHLEPATSFSSWTAYVPQPALDRIREVLDDGQSVGQVKRIASRFTCVQEFPAETSHTTR